MTRVPAPPQGHSAWSVMTLADHLCTPPAAVCDALGPFIREYGVDPTFGLRRSGHYFFLPSKDDRSGVTVTDSYLTDAAVAHLVERSATASWPPVRTEPFGVVIPRGSS